VRYAIVGAGHIGSALARQFARSAIDVAIANREEPDALAPIVAELGSHVVSTTLGAALQCDLVVLAIPFTSVADLASAVDWTGKLVVDATNPHTAAETGGKPSTRIVADRLPGARVVKAFNTLPAAVLAADPRVGAGRRVLFVSSDDPSAAATVRDVISQLGFAPILLGDLAGGSVLQQRGGPLFLAQLILMA
jgi:8-hydroxy-5-deazaflavin:NADPH oxidoreductase